MLFIYLGVLAVGVLAILVLLSKEKKSREPNPADLLRSLDAQEPVEENADDHASFLKRLHLDNQKPHPSLNPEPLSAEQAAQELKIHPAQDQNNDSLSEIPNPTETIEDLKQKLLDQESRVQKLQGNLTLSTNELSRAADEITRLHHMLESKNKEIEDLTFELSEKKYPENLIATEDLPLHSEPQEKSQKLPGNDPASEQEPLISQGSIESQKDAPQVSGIEKIFLALADQETEHKDSLVPNDLSLDRFDVTDHDQTKEIHPDQEEDQEKRQGDKISPTNESCEDHVNPAIKNTEEIKFIPPEEINTAMDHQENQDLEESKDDSSDNNESDSLYNKKQTIVRNIIEETSPDDQQNKNENEIE